MDLFHHSDPGTLVDNAYVRVLKRLEKQREAFKRYRKTDSQEDLEAINRLIVTPIKEGPIE